MWYYQFYQPFVISLICCLLLWPYLIELEGLFEIVWDLLKIKNLINPLVINGK